MAEQQENTPIICDKCTMPMGFPALELSPTTDMDSPYLAFDVTAICPHCGHRQELPKEPRLTIAQAKAEREYLHRLKAQRQGESR